MINGTGFRINWKSGLLGILVLLSTAFFREAPGEAFDKTHKLYGEVLSLYVKDGLVDYAGLKSDPGGLRAYLESTAKVTRQEFEGWTPNERLAFLINLYNARTLGLIIDNYPVKSIRDIGDGANGPWDEPVVELFGDTITLNALENGMIRRDYKDPRIHFALVCAAMGCPLLLGEPYIGAALENQLDARTRIFLADTEKNSADRDDKTLRISPIFEWYGEDFISAAGSVTGFLKKYYMDAPVEGYKIAYTGYDWSLNDIKGKAK